MNIDTGVMTIEECHKEELHANACELHVTIRGASLVTGDAALKKAREVRALAEALLQCGITETDIRIQSVFAETQSGLFTKSSTACYNLRIICKDLGKLADVLGAITSQKNTTLGYMDWQFPDRTELQKVWRSKCIDRANQRAESIAAALRVPIEGVKQYAEELIGEDSGVVEVGAIRGIPRMARASVSSQELGLAVSHTRDCGVHVRIEFKLGPRKS